MSYVVKVTQEDGQWLADVVNLRGAHTYAGSLTSLAVNVDEVIRLVDDSIDDRDELDLDWDYSDVDVSVRNADEIGRDRQKLIVDTRQNEVATILVVNQLSEKGLSSRDISHLLRMSAGRVSQIRNAKRSRTRDSERSVASVEDMWRGSDEDQPVSSAIDLERYESV